jgi:hypothetical protein
MPPSHGSLGSRDRMSGYNEIHNEDMNGYDITNGDVWMSG